MSWGSAGDSKASRRKANNAELTGWLAEHPLSSNTGAAQFIVQELCYLPAEQEEDEKKQEATNLFAMEKKEVASTAHLLNPCRQCEASPSRV